MAYEGSITGPRIVSYNLATHTYEYIMRMVNLGVFEGPLGDMKPTEQVAKVLEALHQVVAGGEVKIEVVHRGNPDILNDLNRIVREALAESNEINKKAGFYFTAAV